MIAIARMNMMKWALMDEVHHQFVKSSGLFRYYSEIKDLIDKHKWYESEKAGHDIGIERAVVDWLMFHSVKDVAALKKKYKID